MRNEELSDELNEEALSEAARRGARRAPYKPLMKRGLWAHGRAPLQAQGQIKSL